MSSSNETEREVYPKSFLDLVREVHDRGLCGRCGGCISFCSASDIGAIGMTEDGPPVYINEDACLKCGICYLVCPQTAALDEDLKAKFAFKAPIGHVDNVYSTRAVAQEVREAGTDGGVVTAILLALLEDGRIDGAIVCHNEGPFERVPTLARTPEELLDAAGTHWDLVDHVEQLGKYSTFIPVITELRRVADEDMQRIAVVGVPCQIHSIRKMQALNIIPAHVVDYALGLFCFESLAFDEDARRSLEEKFNFKFSDIVGMNIKDALYLKLRGDGDGARVVRVPFEELDAYVRPACRGCRDFSNHYADASFGGLGSPDGVTTVLVRTKVGREAYNLARRKQRVEELDELNTAVEKSKKMAAIVSQSKLKQARADRYAETHPVI